MDNWRCRNRLASLNTMTWSRHARRGGPDDPLHVGALPWRAGADLDVHTARKAARLAALNALAVARQHLGSLDKVTRIVRLGVLVATSGDVREQPKVADAASDLLQDVFGQDKNPSRLVYGVASLSLGTPVLPLLHFQFENDCQLVNIGEGENS
jgi:enamine deaminase RidA (YjgF/YER057c/UK114 family)